MEVFALGMKVKEEGAATVSAALKKVRADLKDTAKETGTLDKGFAKLKLGAIAAGAALGAAVVGGIALMIKNSADAQRVQAQLGAALKSTGAEAWTSIDALNAHAAALQRVTTWGDEAVGETQALLLTFKEIQGPAFGKATEAVLDVATAMQTDLKSAAIQVGKALNDPILGVTALARSGIQFTESQKETIKSLVETNRLAEAQAIVLHELESQFGGSAKSARDTLGGALASLSNTWGDLFEVSRESSGGIIAAIEGVTAFLPKLRDGLNDVLQGWRFIWVDLQVVTTLAIEKVKAAIDEVVTGFKNIGRILTLQEPIISTASEDYKVLKDQLEAWREEEYAAIIGVGKKTDAVRKLTTATAALATAQERVIAAPNGRSNVTLGMPTGAATGAGVQTANLRSSLSAGFAAMRTEAQIAAAQLAMDLRENLAENVAGAITMGLVSGIESGVASGSIGEGFKSLTGALLAGLGGSMIEFGVASLKLAALMDGLLNSFMNLLPGGAVAKAVAMIALGAALKGAAGAAFGGRGKGGGGFGSGGAPSFSGPGGLGGSNDVTRLLFGATSAGTAAGMQPRQANNITIIGPDDPTAQRAIEELISKGSRRGTL